MCHYAPKLNPIEQLSQKAFSLLTLVDSTDWQGTTDITRIIAVGELTQEQKEHFTLVLQGHIRLAMAKFQYGCSGANLDPLVRAFMGKRIGF